MTANKKQKRKRTRLVFEKRCVAGVHYTTYPERGVRSDRDSTCSRWTMFDCGYCRRHCKMGLCRTHSIMWVVSAEGEHKRRAGRRARS